MRERQFGGKWIRLIEGNIAMVAADAVVNAANKSLVLGSGVAGAIRKLGGPSIQAECNRLDPIEVGGAVITGAGNLSARFVIHAAGPVYGEGDEDRKLELATLNSLLLAEENELSIIVFPAISTGIFKFPLQRCSEVMLRTVQKFLETGSLYPEVVMFCLYGDDAYRTFTDTLERLVPSGKIRG